MTLLAPPPAENQPARMSTTDLKEQCQRIFGNFVSKWKGIGAGRIPQCVLSDVYLHREAFVAELMEPVQAAFEENIAYADCEAVSRYVADHLWKEHGKNLVDNICRPELPRPMEPIPAEKMERLEADECCVWMVKTILERNLAEEKDRQEWHTHLSVSQNRSHLLLFVRRATGNFSELATEFDRFKRGVPESEPAGCTYDQGDVDNVVTLLAARLRPELVEQAAA